MNPADNVMPPVRIPQFGQTASSADLGAGFGLLFRAVAAIAKTPRLMLLSLLSAAVAGACLIALPFALWPLSDKLVSGFVSPDGGTWAAAAAFGLHLGVFLSLLLVTALTVPSLLLAPLQDPISEATEAACGNFVASPGSFLRGVSASLKHTILRLFCLATGLLVLLPLNLIPGLGSVAWSALTALWTMFLLSVEHLSGPMSRHLYPFRAVMSALGKRKRLALGFGAGLLVLLFVPVLDFFLTPVAIVGATLLYRGLREVGVIALPP